MADANREACSRVEEIEIEKAKEVREEDVKTDESMVEKWTMLNENSEHSDNESSLSQETQENWIIVNSEAVSKNDNVLPKDNNAVSKDDDLSNNCDGISRIEDNFDGSDGSDSISVITESDIDSNNRISQVNDSFQINSTFQDSSKLLRLERQRSARREKQCLIACALGLLCVIGSLFYPPFIVPEAFEDSNGIDKESFKMTTYNVDNIYKELPQVKAVLNEMRALISDDTKNRNNFLVQLSEIIDSSNKMNKKPIMAVKESFNSNSYPLDQLQVSLHVLSSLVFIDDNIPLKNEMSKTLDTVNNTKAFYETLVSFNNNTQNNSTVLEFLQSGNDIIRIASEQLFSDLVEKIVKVMLNVHKKYANVGQKLSKKLCHLKNILPDNELLKQLTENNQFFKNYDKSCSNHDSKKLNNKGSKTEGANNPKQQIREADDTILHMKHKKNVQKIYNNRENSLNNNRNGTQSINNSTTANSKKIKLNVDNNYNKIREKLYEVLSYLEDIRSDPSKLEQLTKNCGENKKSINRCEGKNDCVQSDTCPFFELNKSLEFDNDIITSNTVPDHATKSYNVYANSKHKVNSTKTVLDHGNSSNILAKEKSRSKQENDFKSKHSTKKPFNNKNAYKREDVSPQNKMKNHIPKDTFNHHESKQSSFNKRTIKQDDEPYTFGTDDINKFSWTIQYRIIIYFLYFMCFVVYVCIKILSDTFDYFCIRYNRLFSYSSAFKDLIKINAFIISLWMFTRLLSLILNE
ncbi:asparagine-rich protein-like isoform X2 [Linepithema humile]|uniref:asparagine-rich protein-like isoform X2 n=1 Tax=Linepithema humile TaxID=83485 RepID=UPI000623230F|nr:PREDICTED: probable cyclin-dependent serine/threonine-protein kinase DDB_G0292550 isoform X2 [Linepithema humile]